MSEGPSRPGGPRRRVPSEHPVLHRVAREGRWWWLQAQHSRRIWRWAALLALLLFLALALLRRPVAEWFWSDSQIEQLLEQGEQALRSGHLSQEDGSGARERYLAVLALDADREQAREGLARTAQAALQQARAELDAGQLDAAEHSLALARELQVPQLQSDAVALQLHARRTSHAGLEPLLVQARAALAEGRLDDGADSALPLFQRLLTLQPDHREALEGREDALSDLLQQARSQMLQGELRAAADKLQRARHFDPGHADLPMSQEQLARALEQRVQQGLRALRRQQLQRASDSFVTVLAINPEDAAAQRGRDQLVLAYAQRAQKAADDFQFTAAEQDLARALALGAAPMVLQRAQQGVQRARQAQQALQQPGGNPAARERMLRRLLQNVVDAERAGNLITPPGTSAFDALREAQALAPRDARVRQAAERLLPASRQCFEDHLRQNRVRAAQECLQSWQTLAPTDAALADARGRLAERWLAIASERLGRGDVAFASDALQQARQLGSGPGNSAFRQLSRRLRDVGALP